MAAPCFQCIEQRREDARARGADRMAQRHGSPVHVHLLGVQPELVINCQRDRGEGFVDFEKIDVGNRQPGQLQHPFDRFNRRDGEPFRRQGGAGVAYDSAHRLKTQRFSFILGHHHKCGCAIVTGRRVAHRQHAIVLKYRFQGPHL